MKTFGKRRNVPEINAGSMADIAFLLLIFFLVATTILSDKGILVKLPVWDSNRPEVKIRERNHFNVAINTSNELFARGENIRLEDLRERVKNFIINTEGHTNLAMKPSMAVVSLKHDRGTTYKTYLEVYNELKGAYRELWDEQAQLNYGATYADLSLAHKKSIRNDIPMVISEFEPENFGEK